MFNKERLAEIHEEKKVLEKELEKAEATNNFSETARVLLAIEILQKELWDMLDI